MSVLGKPTASAQCQGISSEYPEGAHGAGRWAFWFDARPFEKGFQIYEDASVHIVVFAKLSVVSVPTRF